MNRKQLAKKVLGEGTCRRLAACERSAKRALSGWLAGVSPPQRALKWLRSSMDSALDHPVRRDGHQVDVALMAQVAPTLSHYGEKETAERLVQRLLSLQRPDGSWAAPDGRSHLKATAAALDALVRVGSQGEGSDEAVRRAQEVVYEKATELLDRGVVPEAAGPLPLVAVTLLICAAEVPGTRGSEDLITRVAECLSGDQPAVPEAADAYKQIERADLLLRLGRDDAARPVLEAQETLQATAEVTAAEAKNPSVCSACLARLASCWYQVGVWHPADSALARLEQNQQHSGAWRSGSCRNPAHGRDTGPLLAAKHYLDANRHRVVSYMDRMADQLPRDVSSHDGRAQAVLQLVKPGDHVVEVGCGKGRFLRLIRQACPQSRCTGIDISAKLLAELGPEITALEGWMEDIPCEDNHFDIVFSVEAVEHSANIEAAVRELVRIAKPGGWVLIIDKQRSQWGRLPCPSWERWPSSRYLSRLLRNDCAQVRCETVSYGRNPADGLIVAWQGRKGYPRP